MKFDIVVFGFVIIYNCLGGVDAIAKECEDHSDCNKGVHPSYCAIYQNNRECWPCVFCEHFNDAVGGSCANACPGKRFGIVEANGVPHLGIWNGTEINGGDLTSEDQPPLPTDSIGEAEEDSEAPTTTLPPQQCPKMCATCEVNINTDKVYCTACSDQSKLLHSSGKCLSKIYCKSKKISSGNLLGESCKCANNNCHYCVQQSNGDVCRKCRNGFYLLDGDCVESCPSHMAQSGISKWGRVCRNPFTCRSGRAKDEDGKTFGCKCASVSNGGGSNCHQCDHEAGGYGEKCSVCNNKKFLHNNVCHDSCDSVDGTSNLAHYIPSGSYGRECRNAFICSGGKDADDVACKCPRTIGRNNCHTCLIANPDPKCVRCTNNHFLHEGMCKKRCPKTTLAVGTETMGRVCVGNN